MSGAEGVGQKARLKVRSRRASVVSVEQVRIDLTQTREAA
jgi:hypothetical protein